MATFNKFNAWAENMVEVANLGTDQFVVALSNTLPVNTNSVLADITQIAYTNLSSRNLTTASSTQSGGTYSLTFNDLTLTASGAVATFRYVIIFDDTPTSPADPVVGWYDYGSSITMASGETLLIDFTGAALTVV
jgi:hypothetical protein